MTKKNIILKQFLKIILVLILASAAYAMYIIYKPHRDVRSENNYITVSAQSIYDQYKSDEAKANKMYLDKAIQVTGEVEKIEKNKDGKQVISLKTGDPIGNVRCTLKDFTDIPTEKNVTIRGICQGYILDVTITEAFQIK